MISAKTFFNFQSNKNSPLKFIQSSKTFFLFFIFIGLLTFVSCAGSSRFTSEKNNENLFSSAEIRVLLDETENADFLTIQSSAYLFNDLNRLALIETGNVLQCYNNSSRLTLKVNEQTFSGTHFYLKPINSNHLVINGKSYRGTIELQPGSKNIKLINLLNIEDYVRGVLAKEMPVGKDEENLEALKALAICARTYALLKIKEGKTLYDLFDDTRDQVYGGFDAEHPVTNKAVDETSGIILKNGSEPAVLFYHSTCGGHTENAKNIFSDDDIYYLRGVEDGNPPYCKKSPRFQWIETYHKQNIVERLINAGLISSGRYLLNKIEVKSRFESGRVNELRFYLFDENNEGQIIKVFGNDIREVLRTADGKNILWSTLFDIDDDDDQIIIIGKGFGHGVGLCQWGAIYLSQIGWNYDDILQHYYPGVEKGRISD